jgi:flagellar L-ring protein precursor FlgH
MANTKLLRSAFVAFAAAGMLTGCNTMTRLSEVGQAPKMTTIQDPTQSAKYRPVSLPMPSPSADTHRANSLWRSGARAFFKDQRAAVVGDILTVEIAIADKAQLNNTSTRDRANTEDSAITNLLGYESSLAQVLPEAIQPSNVLTLDSTTSNSGKGTIDRDETIDLKVAAIVTQTLPNGNLVISGRQEVRVNYEVRELQIAGIIRPEDITSSNTITYEKIAEARIAYGGRGHISDFQQPRWGQQIIDVLFPF